MWPLNTEKLLGSARPKFSEEPNVLVDAMQLTELYKKKQESASRGDCLQPVVMHCGSVRTQQGLLVSGEEAIGMIKAEEDMKRLRAAE